MGGGRRREPLKIGVEWESAMWVLYLVIPNLVIDDVVVFCGLFL